MEKPDLFTDQALRIIVSPPTLQSHKPGNLSKKTLKTCRFSGKPEGFSRSRLP